MGRVTIVLLSLVLWFSAVQPSDVRVLADQHGRDVRNMGSDVPYTEVSQSELTGPEQVLVDYVKADSIRDAAAKQVHMDLKKSLSTSSLQETFPEEQERSRLLVVPYARRNTQAKQILLSTNILEDYPQIDVGRVISVGYVSRLRKVLVSTYMPQRIVSYDIDRPGWQTLHEGIRSYGMAVDEGRQLIFLTTTRPDNGITRMTTRGQQFQSVVQLSRDHSPFSIALDPINRKLYVANSVYVLSLGYDGGRLETLYTGRSIYAVVLNPMENTLYFNDNKKIMRMSYSGTEVREVYDLGYKAWRIVLYNSSLYIGGYSFMAREKYIDMVYVGNGDVSVTNVSREYRRLQRFDRSNGLNICLLP